MGERVRQPALGDTLASPALLLATGFGTGLFPVAPGTVGSLAGLPWVWLILSTVPVSGFIPVALVLLVIGVLTARVAGRQWGQVDHSAIVIDEVLGQLITLMIPVAILGAWASPWLLYVGGFLLFRVFDITKPWPANVFDQRVKNAWGVMLDDVAAGIWAGLILTLLLVVVDLA